MLPCCARQLIALGHEVYGGVNAPYVWMKTRKQFIVGLFQRIALFEKDNCNAPGTFWKKRRRIYTLQWVCQPRNDETGIRKI